MPDPFHDLRQELLAAFDAEYRDHLGVVRGGLAAARRGEAADLRDIFRRLHSLKGAARAVDLPTVEALSHELEAQMASVIEAGTGLGRDRIAAIEAGLDAIETAIETAMGSGAGAADATALEEPATGYLRVEAGQVTDLVIAMTQLTQAVERHDGLGARAQDVERTAGRARRALERLLSRNNAPGPLSGIAGDLAAVLREAVALRHDLRETSWALDEAVRRLRDDVDRITLVPAETVFGPMARMLRDLARDEGVEVEPDFIGLGLQADRRVLQALKDPVLQLLRNAVSHGSESPDRRQARGRTPPTRVTLALRSGGGGRLIVTVTDDGPGPDLEAIRHRARDRGMLTAATAAAATPERLMALVFEAGFTTRDDVGQLSGRGMGLSIVAEAARALGGCVRMSLAQTAGPDGRLGGGTMVEIAVPLTVARQTALLLGLGDDIVGLPTAAVLRLLRVPLTSIEPLGGRLCVRTDGAASTQAAPVAVLGALLGMGSGALPVHDGHVKLAVLRGDAFGQPLALAVDRFQDVRRCLSRSAEIVGLDTDLVAGFVMIGSETPAPLLSPEGLVARWSRRGGWAGEVATGDPLPDDSPVARTILVADDSITSRTLEKSILEAHGYRVITAVDGLDALEILHAYRAEGAGMIDMVLADIEMPRMDGFTLLQAIKDDSALADIPVIIMTSRESPSDVRRGLDLGAAAYVAKQTFDQQDLLGTIGRLL